MFERHIYIYRMCFSTANAGFWVRFVLRANPRIFLFWPRQKMVTPFENRCMCVLTPDRPRKQKERKNHHPPQPQKKEMLPTTTTAHKLTTVANILLPQIQAGSSFVAPISFRVRCPRRFLAIRPWFFLHTCSSAPAEPFTDAFCSFFFSPDISVFVFFWDIWVFLRDKTVPAKKEKQS